MNIMTETDHYAVIRVPNGNVGYEDWETVMNSTLADCEELRDKGYYPLHYVPRLSAWVCEKLPSEQETIAA